MIRTVTVLQDDIDHGARENTEWCPVARAVRRDLADLAGFTCVHVVPYRLYLDSNQVPMPPAVADFIDRYDNGDPVEPFKFEIEVPGPGRQ